MLPLVVQPIALPLPLAALTLALNPLGRVVFARADRRLRRTGGLAQH